MIGEIGIDPIGICLEHPTVLVTQGCELLLGQPGEVEGAEEHVGVDLAVSEHLGEAPRPDVPPEIHLPETVLGMDVTLGEKEVVGGGGVDVGNPFGVANHLDR